MDCLPNKPHVNAAVEELQKHLHSVEMASVIIAKNKGNAISSTPTGKGSLLYKSLKEASGNDTIASVLKSSIYSPAFMSKHGDWINNPNAFFTDVNGEPTLFNDSESYYYMTSNNAKVPVKIPTAKDREDIAQDNYIEYLYTPDTTGSISKGSVVVASLDGDVKQAYIVLETNPKTGAMTKGFTPVVKNGVIPVLTMDTSKRKVEKKGNFDIIRYVRGKSVSSFVVLKDKIFDVTNPDSITEVLKDSDLGKSLRSLGARKGMSNAEGVTYGNRTLAESIYEKVAYNRTTDSKVEAREAEKTTVGGKTFSDYKKLEREVKAEGKIYALRTKDANDFGNPYTATDSAYERSMSSDPLVHVATVKEAVIKYIDWVLHSTNSRAKWIRAQIASGELKGKGIVYYKSMGEASHADALDYLINKHELEKQSQSKELIKRSIFTVRPNKQPDMLKAPAKASVATKYIGFGESSTGMYREQVGKNIANTGVYSSNDVVFTSINGNVTEENYNKTIKEVTSALESGATVLTDNKKYTDNSTYNKGEKRLKAYLESKGYIYSEVTVDGQILGVWNKNQIVKQDQVQKIDVNYIANTLIENHTAEGNSMESAFSRYNTGESTYILRTFLEDAAQNNAELAEFLNTNKNAIELIKQELNRKYLEHKSKETKQPERSTEIVNNTVSSIPKFNPDAKIFIHAVSSVEAEKVMQDMDQAIADGVKVFITLPPEDRNEFDNKFLNKLQSAPHFWNYKTIVSEGKVIHYLSKPEMKVAETFDQIESRRTGPFKYYDNTKLTIREGSVVQYTVKGKNKDTYIVQGFSSNGAVKLIDKNGIVLPGTPMPDKVNVIGAYPYGVAKNGKKYIVADNNDVYSIATGAKVFDTNEVEKGEILRSKRHPEDVETVTVDVKKSVIEVAKDKVNKKVEANRTTVDGNIVTVRNISIDLYNELGINFMLSEDQIGALNEFAAWLDDFSDNRPFSIEGIAGSGKTTMLRVLREYAILKGMDTSFTAMTHQAAINLEASVRNRSVTLHSKLGLSPEVNLDDREELAFNIDEAKPNMGDDSVLFIDEASMASNKEVEGTSLTQLLFDLNRVTPDGRVNKRVVLIGNLSQLNAIGESTNKRVFSPVETRNVKLSQSMRQQESNPAMPLFKYYSEDQRQMKGLTDGTISVESYNPVTNQGLKWTNSSGDFLKNAVADFQLAKASGNWLYTRLLTNSNRKVAEYNSAIRAQLFPESVNYAMEESRKIYEKAGETPTNRIFKRALVEGEAIISNRNSEVLRKGVPYVCTSISDIEMETVKGTNIHLPIRTVVMKPAFAASYVNKEGETVIMIEDATIKFIDINSPYYQGKYHVSMLGTSHQGLEQLGKHILELKREIKRTPKYPRENKRRRAALNDQLRAIIDNYQMFEDLKIFSSKVGESRLIELRKGIGEGKNLLKKEDTITVLNGGISYYYAGTVHKAQGSTYVTAHVDQAEIAWNVKRRAEEAAAKGNKEEALDKYEDYNKSIYTSFTRAQTVTHALTNEKIQGLEENSTDYAGMSFQNRQVVKNTMTEVVLKSAEALGIDPNRDLKYSDDLDGKPWRALSNAIHDATILTSNNPVIRLANETLKERLAVKENDKRVTSLLGEDNIDLYNAYVYDIYSNGVIREIGTKVEDEMLHDLGTFFIRTGNASKKLNTEIRDLERQITELKQSGAPIAASQELAERLGKRKTLKENLETNETITEVLDIAEADIKRATEIVTKKNVSEAELIEGLKLCDTWILAGNFEDVDKHLYLDSSEATDSDIQQLFYEVRDMAESIKNRLKVKGKSIVVNWVNSTLKTVFNYDDIIKLKSKMNGIYKYALAAGNADNPFIKAIVKMINKANSMVEIKAITESRKLADLYKKLKDSGYDLNIFRQKDKDGIITGNLVNKYSYEYTEGYRKCINGVYTLKFLHNNSTIVDPRKATADPEAYITELTPTLGEENARAAVLDAVESYKEFIAIKQNYMMAEFNTTNTGMLSTQQKALLTNWELENSPIARYMIMTDPAYASNKLKDINIAELGQRFLTIVPNKFDAAGEETGHYDNTYDAIRSNPLAADFYTMAEKITKEAKENFNVNNMSEHSLAFVNSTMIQEFNALGIKEFTKNSLIKYFKAGMDYANNIDPMTDKPVRTLQRNIDTLDKRIQAEYMRLWAIEYNNAALTAEQKLDLRKRASDSVSQDDRDDLFMSLNSLNMASLAFAHKSQIKPQLDMAMYYLDDIKGMTSLERLRQALKDEKAKPQPDLFVIKKLEKALQNSSTSNPPLRNVTESDVENVKEMLNYFIDRDFYDVPDEDRSSKFGPKLYTKEEKDEKAKLEAYIDRESNSASPNLDKIEEAKTRLAKLGNQASVNKVIRLAMDGIRITVLGWSLKSFIGNLLQGQIANVYHAAAGQYYNMDELKKAAGLLTTQKGKFDNIVHSYSILGDIMYDFAHNSPFEEKKGLMGRAANLLKPFEGNKIAETANQGVMMTAIMLHTQFTDTVNNKQVSMWDAVGDDGQLLPGMEYKGLQGNDAISEIVVEIRKQVAEIHGDYGNPLLADKYIVGKMALQFKKWFFQPFVARFGADGRFTAAKNAIIAFNGNFMELRRAYKNGEMSPETMAKLRVALTEVTVAVVSALLTALIKASMCGNNSNKSKCGGASANYIMNMLEKIDRETRSFVSLNNYYSLVTNPIAISRYMQSLIQSINAIEKGVTDGEWDNTQGENKLANIWGKQIPIISRIKSSREWMDKVARAY